MRELLIAMAVILAVLVAAITESSAQFGPLDPNNPFSEVLSIFGRLNPNNPFSEGSSPFGRLNADNPFGDISSPFGRFNPSNLFRDGELPVMIQDPATGPIIIILPDGRMVR